VAVHVQQELGPGKSRYSGHRSRVTPSWRHLVELMGASLGERSMKQLRGARVILCAALLAIAAASRSSAQEPAETGSAARGTDRPKRAVLVTLRTIVMSFNSPIQRYGP